MNKDLIGLILAIVVTFGCAGMAVSFNSEITKKKERVKSERSRLKKLRDETRDLTLEIQELRSYINGAQDDSAVDNKEVEGAVLTRARDIVGRNLKGSDPDKTYSTLVEAYPDLFEEIDYLNEEIRKGQGSIKGVREEFARKLEEYSTTKKTADDQIEKLRNDKERIQGNLLRIIQDRETERDDFKKKHEESKNSASLLRNHYERAIIPKLKTEITSLNRVIVKLEETIRRRKKIEGLDPDGEVVAVNQELGYVWLNLGQMHGLRKGLIFRVFEYVKGGKRVFKGKIEVIRVKADMAQAKITQQINRKNPLIKGDYIISPIFDRNQKKTFVFAGHKAVNHLYSPSKYKKMLEDHNQTVLDRVTNKTDFIVLLDNYKGSQEYKDSQKFPWIIFLREDDLLEFLTQK